MKKVKMAKANESAKRRRRRRRMNADDGDALSLLNGLRMTREGRSEVSNSKVNG
jgi:hypothetical protein